MTECSEWGDEPRSSPRQAGVEQCPRCRRRTADASDGHRIPGAIAPYPDTESGQASEHRFGVIGEQNARQFCLTGRKSGADERPVGDALRSRRANAGVDRASERLDQETVGRYRCERIVRQLGSPSPTGRSRVTPQPDPPPGRRRPRAAAARPLRPRCERLRCRRRLPRSASPAT